mgnify:CR=1 FL=1
MLSSQFLRLPALFFFSGWLAAATSFVFQVFFSGFPILVGTNQLICFVVLEEVLRFFYWRQTLGITALSASENFWKILPLTPFFAGGFWFLELLFLKLKTGQWEFSIAGLLLFGIHLLLTIIIATANIQSSRKRFWVSAALFLLAVAAHFSYNWTVEKFSSCQEKKAVIKYVKILKNNPKQS